MVPPERSSSDHEELSQFKYSLVGLFIWNVPEQSEGEWNGIKEFNKVSRILGSKNAT